MAKRPEQFEQLRAAMPALANTPEAIHARVAMMEQVLERSFTLPILNRKVGLDFALGLVPVIGDIVTGAMGLYIVWEARNLGMSKLQLARMAANVGFDTLLGSVPLVGDAFDLFWRSNTRNLKIIRKHLDRHHPATRIIDQ
ncbi:DUF4112 domain-containing protein [Blastomonas sp.]|uniref:DUF4112 domain-containing protein n=1 Tax=Blastomonas sp. TaxID=1909299 RepID=UPI0035943BB9